MANDQRDTRRVVEAKVTIHASKPNRRSHATLSMVPATTVSVKAESGGAIKPKRVEFSHTAETR